MSSNFFGMEIGLNALRTFKTAQEVVGNNISNVSTPGYVRREAVLQPIGTPDSLTGGVNVENIRRLCDGFAQSRARAASGQARQEEYLRDVTLEAEQFINPLTEGSLYDKLDGFWGALQDLSNSPADASLRQAAVSAAGGVAGAVNSLTADLSALRARIAVEAEAEASLVNARLAEVAALNRQIQEAEAAGLQANSLRDQRDTAVDELAGLLPVDVCESADGFQLSSCGQVLVLGKMPGAVEAGLEGGSPIELKFRLAGSGRELAVASGKLGGLAQAVSELDGLSSRVREIFESLSSTAAGSLNAVHSAGFRLSGLPSGEDLFTISSEGRLRVNPLIEADPSLLAASATGSAGDGANAAALAAVLKPSSGAASAPSGRVAALASVLGARAEELEKSASRAGLVERAALDRYESTAGVSLDEETAKLLELQNSYAAAAKFISAANQMMDDLLAMV